MALRLYNTMSCSIEEFIPITAKEVGMYSCGPTVYNYAYIGNLRTFLFEDLETSPHRQRVRGESCDEHHRCRTFERRWR